MHFTLHHKFIPNNKQPKTSQPIPIGYQIEVFHVLEDCILLFFLSRIVKKSNDCWINLQRGLPDFRRSSLPEILYWRCIKFHGCFPLLQMDALCTVYWMDRFRSDLRSYYYFYNRIHHLRCAYFIVPILDNCLMIVKNKFLEIHQIFC